MQIIQNILAFIFVFGFLVVFHELGHYIIARVFNVKVIRFSVGFGKIIWSKRIGKDNTEWALSAIPLGGYVKMLDERDESIDIKESDLHREFTRQPVLNRICIVAAGPLANFLIAILIFTGLNFYGVSEPIPKLEIIENSIAKKNGFRSGDIIKKLNSNEIYSWSDFGMRLVKSLVNNENILIELERFDNSDNTIKKIYLDYSNMKYEEIDNTIIKKLGFNLAKPQAILGKIFNEGPADLGGLKKGDKILKINNINIDDASMFIKIIGDSPNKKLDLVILRSGKVLNYSITPESKKIKGKQFGKIQAELDLSQFLVTHQMNLIPAFMLSIEKTWNTIKLTIQMLIKMLIGEASIKNLSGPITIAEYAGKTASISIQSFLTFIAFISISLGIMNLLPIPVLDGGHLLYYSLELVFGRPMPKNVIEISNRIGLGLLLVLMIIATFNDITR